MLTFYKTKPLRTTTNYLVVNMAISDVFVPVMEFFIRLPYSSEFTEFLGTAVCTIFPFLVNTSYGMSLSSFVVITVYRFCAVVFPTRARVEDRKTRVLLLLGTWLLPIAINSPDLYYTSYNSQTRKCCSNMRKHVFLVCIITFLVLFVALPFLFMLVLYPVIVITLVRQKVTGNSTSHSWVMRRRNQNIRTTKMFIAIIVALLLTYGTYQFAYVIVVFSLASDWCLALKILYIALPFRLLFHAINPVIYFMFCSSYRMGIKRVFSCCCDQSPFSGNPSGREQIELN